MTTKTGSTDVKYEAFGLAMTPGAKQDESATIALRKAMIGHGALLIFAGMLFGVGLWMFLLGGFEIVPGYILNFQLPGTPDGWRFAHIGPVMNGLMVIAIAFGVTSLDLPAKTAKLIGWTIILDGWSNTCFYFFSNFSPNRGLAFSTSRLGSANIFSYLALAPAYVFGVLAMIALIVMGWKAIANGKKA